MTDRREENRTGDLHEQETNEKRGWNEAVWEIITFKYEHTHSENTGELGCFGLEKQSCNPHVFTPLRISSEINMSSVKQRRERLNET